MRKKDLSLEGLRGIAALGVVFAHFLYSFVPHLISYSRPGLYIPPRYPVEQYFAVPWFSFFYNGSFAVSIFFVMSGYVLTKQFVETGNADSLRAGAIKRYPRLVIPVFVATLLAYLLYATGAMHNHLAGEIGTAGWPLDYYRDKDHITFGSALFDGLFGTALIGNQALDGPLWTIRIEILGSLILFATYAVFGVRNRLANAVAFMSLAVTVSAGSPYLLHYAEMVTGSLLHHVVRRLQAKPRLSVGLLLLGLLFGSYDFSPIFAVIHRHLSLPVLPFPLFNVQAAEIPLFHSIGAVMLVTGLLGSRATARVIGSCVPAYLGRISFSIYLLHWPIIFSLSYWLMGVLKLDLGWSYAAALGVNALVTFPTVIIVSHLFERLVDGPAIRFARALARLVMYRKLTAGTAVRPVVMAQPGAATLESVDG